jgi:hypothetical protein
VALADIEAELVSDVPWRTCAVCHYMSERDEEWAARLRRMLSNEGIKFRDLANKMAKDPEEPSIPWEALSRHARGQCSAREQLREPREQR